MSRSMLMKLSGGSLPKRLSWRWWAPLRFRPKSCTLQSVETVCRICVTHPTYWEPLCYLQGRRWPPPGCTGTPGNGRWNVYQIIGSARTTVKDLRIRKSWKNPPSRSWRVLRPLGGRWRRRRRTWWAARRTASSPGRAGCPLVRRVSCSGMSARNLSRREPAKLNTNFQYLEVSSHVSDII